MRSMMRVCTANRSVTPRLLPASRIRERQGLVPGVVGRVELVQRVDQRVAAGQRHRDEIRLEFHLARQRALARAAPARNSTSIIERIDQTMMDSSQPTHATRRSRRDSCCSSLSSASRRATTWPAICARDVHPAAHGHGALREMAELVRQHRLELAERHDVDQPQADLEILLRRDDEIQQRQVVEHRGIHARREIDLVGARRARFVGQPVDEFEQPRLLRARDLDVVDVVAMLDEEQRLQHEHREECRRRPRR